MFLKAKLFNASIKKIFLFTNGPAFDNIIIYLITNEVKNEGHFIWIGECDAALDMWTVTNPQYCDVPFCLQTDNVRLRNLRLGDDSIPEIKLNFLSLRHAHLSKNT